MSKILYKTINELTEIHLVPYRYVFIDSVTVEFSVCMSTMWYRMRQVREIPEKK